MTDRSRPPGLNTVAEEGLKLGARLAVGLLAVPLVGLSLLARGSAKAEPRVDPAPQPDTAPVASDTRSTVADETQSIPASPSPADGPAEADVELALRKLTEATLAKPAPPRKKSVKAEPSRGKSKTDLRPPRPAASPLHPDGGRTP